LLAMAIGATTDVTFRKAATSPSTPARAPA
jgi:hypothetical protein